MKKRILSFIIALIIPFSICYSDYQVAYANEFIQPMPEYLDTGSAFIGLMALWGVLPEVAALSTFVGVAGVGAYAISKFTVYCTEQGMEHEEDIETFLNGLKQGIIDKTSICYDYFKSWLPTMVNSDSLNESQFYVTGSNNVWIASPTNSNYYLGIMPYTQGETKGYFYVYQDTENIYLNFAKTKSQGGSLWFSFNGNKYGTNRTTYVYQDVTYYTNYCSMPKTSTIITSDAISILDQYMINADSPYNGLEMVLNPPTGFTNTGGITLPVEDTDLSDLPLSGTDSLSQNLTNILEKLGAYGDTLEQILEKVITGEISIDKYREVSQIIAANDDDVITQDGTIPKNDYKPSEDTQPSDPSIEVPTVNPSGEYTVKDLEKVFPFCIPFDLINFINVLKTEPVTPYYEISCSFLGQRYKDNTIIIDLKKFDQVAKWVRLSELFLFIISLIVITRNLIKG